MQPDSWHEIPYNYTSADDRSVVGLLLGKEVWKEIEALREQRRTGRSARHLMRLLGELFVYHRNPFLYAELVRSPRRQRRFFSRAVRGLSIIKVRSHENPRVIAVLHACEGYLQKLRQTIKEESHLRRDINRRMARLAGNATVSFTPFDLISHSTDATDWRLHCPFAVIRPCSVNEVVDAIKMCRQLKLAVIPRGGGTGLTGGAVPLAPRCVIINTEKLNRIHGIEHHSFTTDDGRVAQAPVIHLDAGVITETAMSYARKHRLVFATDPTSAWASTVGGNLAENAGGKSAVRWGTAIDNVLSFRIAFADGALYEVIRIGHPLRKILPHDEVRFEVVNSGGTERREISLYGSDIRKPGLWKDVTNKALGGIPGMQKEGTDGIIVDAKFVLYPEDPIRKALCLEFFGDSMSEAAVVIKKISNAFPDPSGAALQAMEHFDNLYAKAIAYRVKSHRNESPKAVLLIDIGGATDDQISAGVQRVATILHEHENTDLHVAKDAAEAEDYWLDRKRLGAIARRTNAFKLNEDIVIPIDSLAEFVKFCDAMNLREHRHNSERCIIALREVLEQDAGASASAVPLEKKAYGLARCDAASRKLSDLIDPALGVEALHQELSDVFAGYTNILAALDDARQKEQNRIIVIATHMHAGDGNVHVNVPVFSNDRQMMQRAELVVDEVMECVKQLGGVVSGEHGIGITKLKYLDRRRIDELAAYRRTVDPEGMFNPGKLQLMELDSVFTPSFNLLGLEARILQYARLESLTTKIASCVRCGKCKQPCCVFSPQQDLFYHPRNKNLAIAAIIEALLYDAQRDRAVSFELLRHLEEIADHCTVCHRCLKPCPVNIDTGQVSVLEREILVRRRFKHTAMATRLSLKYLRSRSRLLNQVFRFFVLTLGTAAQRLVARALRPAQHAGMLKPSYPVLLLASPMPAPAAKTLRGVLPACRSDQVVLLSPSTPAANIVFYFPGCGSERLYSDISMAAIYLLLTAGSEVIVPPPFLCCGFPMRVNAKIEDHEKIRLRNSIILSQIREMFGHTHIDGCLVSCGTCKEALSEIDIETIFQTRLDDVAGFLMRNDSAPSLSGGFLYHAPCHDSLGGRGKEHLESLGATITTVAHCCSEAGTMAMSRPDITAAMRNRKAEAIAKAAGDADAPTILTNCPACIQGLSRHTFKGLASQHILTALAVARGGTAWKSELIERARDANVVTF